MDLSPEFRRNLWLELTQHRLVAMPTLLALVLLLVYAGSNDTAEALALTSALIAASLLMILGPRATLDCVLEEVRGRTWDGQRMSSIGPWSMAWTKLFGSSAFAWYGGAIALIALLCTSPRWTHPPLKVAALIVAGSLFAQGAACYAGLLAARRGIVRPGTLGAMLVVLLLFTLGPVSSLFDSSGAQVRWWFRSYGALDFALASVSAFAAWALFGVYRAMCEQLLVRTTPWAFVAFGLFLTAYVAGFWIAPGAAARVATNSVVLVGLVVAALLTYLQLFSEHTGVITIRRIQLRLARRDWRRALEELPCWMAGLALAAVFCTLSLVLVEGSSSEFSPAVPLVALPVMLLLGRDVAIFLVFAFAWQPRRLEATVFFYLLVLYGLLPALLHGAGMQRVADLILPPVLTEPGASAVTAAVQLAIAAALVRWRWNSYRRREAHA